MIYLLLVVMCYMGMRLPGRSGPAVSRAKEIRMAEQKFPVMYHSRLWRFAPKILYIQADLDNFLAVVTHDDWVKSPDPPIDPAEEPKYSEYPKTLYSVNINAQVVGNSN